MWRRVLGAELPTLPLSLGSKLPSGLWCASSPCTRSDCNVNHSLLGGVFVVHQGRFSCGAGSWAQSYPPSHPFWVQSLPGPRFVVVVIAHGQAATSIIGSTLASLLSTRAGSLFRGLGSKRPTLSSFVSLYVRFTGLSQSAFLFWGVLGKEEQAPPCQLGLRRWRSFPVGARAKLRTRGVPLVVARSS